MLVPPSIGGWKRSAELAEVRSHRADLRVPRPHTILSLRLCVFARDLVAVGNDLLSSPKYAPTEPTSGSFRPPASPPVAEQHRQGRAGQCWLGIEFTQNGLERKWVKRAEVTGRWTLPKTAQGGNG